MTAWRTKEELDEEYGTYLREQYGDSDGDYSIENHYINVVDILQQANLYDDAFDTWVQNQMDNDTLFEHPQQEMWTRDRALSDYADEHPNQDEVTEWNSVGEAPESEFSEGDVVWVNSVGDRDHGLRGEIVTVDHSDDTYELDFSEYQASNGRVNEESWFNFELVSATNPLSPGNAAPSAAPSDTTAYGIYPSLTASMPLDQSRLLKVGERVESLIDEPSIRRKGDIGVVDHIDVNDRSLTYSIRWPNYGYTHYAHNSTIKPAPSEENTRAALLQQKLEFSHKYLADRLDSTDERWQQYQRDLVGAYSDVGLTAEMVKAIADALRPPKSHSAAITL